ncbi:MAG: MFS transporter [Terracoccus sp.]
MTTADRRENHEPTFVAVLRAPRFLPVFAVNALSMWGDYIARVTIAAVVFERTRSPLATATTFAVSLLPTFFGRSLLGPLVDRIPYKRVLIVAHLLRALCVAGLILLVQMQSSLWGIFGLLVALEAIGGAASASNQVLYTDLFQDRHLYARSVGLRAMSEQVNQAIGLALGGDMVALLGPRTGLLLDLATFVLAAFVIAVVVELRPVHGERGRGFAGFLRDLSDAVGDLVRHPVLARLVLLGACATLGIAAPEALAIPIAGENGWGGALMASPIIGAVFGIVIISRRDVQAQNRLIVPLALAMPLPLLLTAFYPPKIVVALLFFVSGMLQAFMVPLQATFALVTAPALRGRVYSLAGAVSVACAGGSFLAAGWLGQHNDPQVGVAASAGICLALIAAVVISWPHRRMQAAVERAYSNRPSA